MTPNLLQPPGHQGEQGLVAKSKIQSGTKIMKVFSNSSIEPCDQNKPVDDSTISFIQEGKMYYLQQSTDIIETFEDIHRPALANNGYLTYNNHYKSLQSYNNRQSNCAILIENDETWIVANQDINPNEKVSLHYGEYYWLSEAIKNEDSMIRIVASIYLSNKGRIGFDLQNWRSWSTEQCSEYLSLMGITEDSDIVKDLHVAGYNHRVVLYRILQSVGFVKPPVGADYANYPSQLKTFAHQSRDLCLWPVEIGEPTEPTEIMRKKTIQGVEFGPNATWIPFSKTKQLFTSAKTNNIELAKEVVSVANINAYGTCKRWTALHVASYYGSEDVVGLLLKRGAAFNVKDKNGKLPLDLAESQGHSGVVKALLAKYTENSVLVTSFTSLVPDLSDDVETIPNVIEYKIKGNEAYKEKSFKSSFQFYSKGLDLCPFNNEKTILYSNRAQVLITAQAYNIALRDCLCALKIDPTHEKTLLRAAHCLENINIDKALQVLDLMLFATVPDKFVQNRRCFLFLKTILEKAPTEEEETENQSLNEHEKSNKVMISGNEYRVDANLQVESLLELSLQDLRELDKKVGEFDKNYN